LGEAIDYVKTELMPNFDFDAFNHDTPYEGAEGQAAENGEAAVKAEAPQAITEEKIEVTAPAAASTPVDNGSTEEVDKW
jgi:hypothetical protein